MWLSESAGTHRDRAVLSVRDEANEFPPSPARPDLAPGVFLGLLFDH